MPQSRGRGHRRRGDPSRADVRCAVVASLVTLAGLSSLIFLVACSEPRETPRHEVLAAGATATPLAEPPSGTAGATLGTAPPSPASTPTSLPIASPLQELAAPTPEPPPAPPVEAAAPAPDPLEAPAPGPPAAGAPQPAVIPPAAAIEPAAPTPAPPAVAPAGNAALVDRVVQLINAARIDAGLQPLSPSPALMESAQRQAEALAESDRLSHTAPDGSPLDSRVQAAGYAGWAALAEVLAAGPASPEAVVALWLSSPEHRVHLLDPTLIEFGVGYHYQSDSTYGHWWVVDLGTR